MGYGLLSPAAATRAVVTDWAAERPCAAVVVMVTRKPFAVAPVGLAAMVTAAGCVAPLGQAVIATITFSSMTVGPAPGPLWLTRSKFVSSYWRGRSLPVFPSLMARYSLPKSVVEFAKALFTRPVAMLESVPGVVSL